MHHRFKFLKWHKCIPDEVVLFRNLRALLLYIFCRIRPICQLGKWVEMTQVKIWVAMHDLWFFRIHLTNDVAATSTKAMWQLETYSSWLCTHIFSSLVNVVTHISFNQSGNCAARHSLYICWTDTLSALMLLNVCRLFETI